MFKHFISLNWKSFFRAASLKSNLVIKIFMFFGALWMFFVLVGGAIGTYHFITEKLKQNPLELINKFIVYWFLTDLVFKYLLQKMPVVNIKPLLIVPIKKNKVVNFTVGKTIFSFFNFYPAFYFIPISILMVVHGNLPLVNVLGWHLAIMAIVYCNNFINILINNKDILLYSLAGVITTFGLLQYFQIYDITPHIEPIINTFYSHPITAIIPWLLAIALYVLSFNHFKKNLYLDEGLSTKKEDAKTENLNWLNRFGSLSVFLKNDIKLIKRNKRSKMAVLISVLFIFYGLLFFTGAVETYEGPTWRIFAGIFVTGGFLFNFGAFVPSWDSSYYQLMMSQNIKYRDYLLSKWYLMVIAVFITTIIASFYLYFGLEVYLAILTGAIYNIGANCLLVLFSGAYTRTPIDLTSAKNPFGDKQAINLKTILLSLPQMLLPMLIYLIGHYTISPKAGFMFVALIGILGLAFRNVAFNKIESIYKQEKYKTIVAYKQKN